ncbi:unnamed protein product [Thelazia callipaeda]|uniref:VHL domain-containing protein n=1 Tax=Thelazia callipaeda TaxID=103827 RepID=A0A0N5D0F4_THECL|nr:unnamed protein product [Thelazia callipaeda]
MSFDEAAIDSYLSRVISLFTYRSRPSSDDIQVYFTNTTGDIVILCWVNHEGEIIRYMNLGPDQTASVITFTGHYWIALFVHGLPAHFLPNRSEAYLVVRTHRYRAEQVYITRRGFYFCHLCTTRDFVESFRADINEMKMGKVKSNMSVKKPRKTEAWTKKSWKKPEKKLWSKDEIICILKNEEGDVFPKQLFKIFANGQIDLCLQVISELSMEFSDFKLSEVFLTYLKKEFVTMSTLSAFNNAKRWIEYISNNASGIRNHCLLLKQLVRCTNLLQNQQLISLLCEALPLTYQKLCDRNQYFMASTIAEILLYVIVISASYCDQCDLNALWSIWCKLRSTKECVGLAHFHLCTVLVSISLDLDYSHHMQLFVESSIHDLEEDEDFALNHKKQFFILLEANLGPVLTRCQLNQREQLLNILIAYTVEDNSLLSLVRKVFSHSELLNTHSQILQQFIGCLLLNLSSSVNESSQQNENVKEWIEKSGAALLKELENHQNEIEFWKTMITSIPVPYHNLITGKNFHQIIQVIYHNDFPFTALSTSCQVAVFCLSISLLSCIPSEIFDLVMEKVLSVMRYQPKLFRDLLSSCDVKIMKKYIKIFLCYGYSSPFSENAQNLVKELLLSSSDHNVLFTKCDAVLKKTARKLSVEERHYFIKPVCDAVSEFSDKVTAERYNSYRIYIEKVFVFLNEMVSPFNCSGPTKWPILKTALSLLQVLRDIRSMGVITNEEGVQYVTEHIETADEICKNIWKDPENLVKLGKAKPDQLLELSKMSVDWMVKKGKVKRLLSSKYSKNFEFYDEATMNNIISSSSEVQASLHPLCSLKTLLHSFPDGMPAIQKFPVYYALVKQTDESKRKLLLTSLNDVLEVVTSYTENNYLTVIRFLQLILPIVTGHEYEKNFITFCLTALVINVTKLTADFVALSSALSLLLDCLRFGAQSVINDQCSLYAKLFVTLTRAVQKYAKDTLSADSEITRHLSYKLAKIAHMMMKFERSFSRIAPFILSECLEDAKYVPLALFWIFSMCDDHSIALLTTNLPPLQKARLAHLSLHFSKIKKAVV